MAKGAVGKFVEAVNKSPELTKKCKDAIQASKDASGFAALGKANGFEFSAAEAEAYFKETLGATKPPGELKDEALDKVAGGKDISIHGKPSMRPEEINNLNQSVRLFRGLGKAPAWSFFH